MADHEGPKNVLDIEPQELPIASSVPMEDDEDVSHAHDPHDHEYNIHTQEGRDKILEQIKSGAGKSIAGVSAKAVERYDELSNEQKDQLQRILFDAAEKLQREIDELLRQIEELKSQNEELQEAYDEAEQEAAKLRLELEQLLEMQAQGQTLTPEQQQRIDEIRQRLGKIDDTQRDLKDKMRDNDYKLNSIHNRLNTLYQKQGSQNFATTKKAAKTMVDGRIAKQADEIDELNPEAVVKEHDGPHSPEDHFAEFELAYGEAMFLRDEIAHELNQIEDYEFFLKGEQERLMVEKGLTQGDPDYDMLAFELEQLKGIRDQYTDMLSTQENLVRYHELRFEYFLKTEEGFELFEMYERGIIGHSQFMSELPPELAEAYYSVIDYDNLMSEVQDYAALRNMSQSGIDSLMDELEQARADLEQANQALSAVEHELNINQYMRVLVDDPEGNPIEVVVYHDAGGYYYKVPGHENEDAGQSLAEQKIYITEESNPQAYELIGYELDDGTKLGDENSEVCKEHDRRRLEYYQSLKKVEQAEQALAEKAQSKEAAEQNTTQDETQETPAPAYNQFHADLDLELKNITLQHSDISYVSYDELKRLIENFPQGKEYLLNKIETRNVQVIDTNGQTIENLRAPEIFRGLGVKPQDIKDVDPNIQRMERLDGTSSTHNSEQHSEISCKFNDSSAQTKPENEPKPDENLEHEQTGPLATVGLPLGNTA